MCQTTNWKHPHLWIWLQNQDRKLDKFGHFFNEIGRWSIQSPNIALSRLEMSGAFYHSTWKLWTDSSNRITIFQHHFLGFQLVKMVNVTSGLYRKNESIGVTILASTDWFTGNLTWTPHISWENLCFPADFPANPLMTASFTKLKLGASASTLFDSRLLRLCLGPSLGQEFLPQVQGLHSQRHTFAVDDFTNNIQRFQTLWDNLGLYMCNFHGHDE